MVNKKKNARSEKEKRCSRCKKLKPRTGAYFSKNKRSPDGFCSWCKECQKTYRSKRNLPKTYELHRLDCTCKKCEKRNEQIYKNQQGRGRADVAEIRGIQDLNQVDSVLREMAVLQNGINEEMAAYERRVSMIKEYSDEAIDPGLLIRRLYK